MKVGVSRTWVRPPKKENIMAAGRCSNTMGGFFPSLGSLEQQQFVHHHHLHPHFQINTLFVFIEAAPILLLPIISPMLLPAAAVMV